MSPGRALRARLLLAIGVTALALTTACGDGSTSSESAADRPADLAPGIYRLNAGTSYISCDVIGSKAFLSGTFEVLPAESRNLPAALVWSSGHQAIPRQQLPPAVLEALGIGPDQGE